MSPLQPSAPPPGEVFLSRVILTARGLNDPYKVHQALWRAFPGWSPADPRTGRRRDPAGVESPWPAFLWRADRRRDDDGARFVALVQSPTVPAWEQVGAAVTEASVKRVRWNLTAGQSRRFFLRANPTQARKDARQRVHVGGEDIALGSLDEAAYRARRGVRVALWGDDDRHDWLVRKLASAGARLAERTLRDEPFDGPATTRSLGAARTQARKVWRWNDKGREATHDGIDFEGIVEIADPATLHGALLSGLGAAKGIGFGLLSLGLLAGEADAVP